MTQRSSFRIVSLMLLVPLAAACVRRGTYEAALGELDDARIVEENLRDDLRASESREAALQRDVADLEAEIADLEAELERTRAEMTERLQAAADEVHGLQVLLTEQGTEYEQLQDRLEQLRAIEAEVRERNRIYEDVIGRFQSLIDGGQLAVRIVRGRMAIQLPQDVLFASGSATLAAEGRATLTEVGGVLADFEDRTFQVEGHTDDVPISTPQFPSNWELSSARALSVVRVLVAAGVPPENLSGAGYGEYQPVASNDDSAGRRRNRRIEIVMLPNLDVIAASQPL